VNGAFALRQGVPEERRMCVHSVGSRVTGSAMELARCRAWLLGDTDTSYLGLADLPGPTRHRWGHVRRPGDSEDGD
jgi:hypothetical protein